MKKQKASLSVRVKKAWKRDKMLILMSLLPMAMIIVFKYLPMFGIVMAFERYSPRKGYFHSEFVGFKYFIQFFKDPFCLRLIRNTVLLSLYSILWTFPAPIILALLLNEVRHEKYKKVIQTITYLPYFISVVILVGLMKELDRKSVV